jgi:pyruvate carboxylase subunit B
MEVWGGATFDVPTRFLGEDPWDRLRTLRKLLPDTKLMMLLRGQNIVGYRNYADDVVDEFVQYTAECGLDVFRVFDAVNDTRNFEAPFRAIKKAGKHIQGSVCYSLTQRRMGGEVYDLDFYVKKAKIIEQMGADSFCIKDMAGLIMPDAARDLIAGIKNAVDVKVSLHSHCTSGIAPISYQAAIEAGVDILDTAMSPFSMGTSQPPTESIVASLKGTPRDTGIDLLKLRGVRNICLKIRENILDC